MKFAAYRLGIFCREGKTRFVAWVEIGGRRRKVYVPMSTKLSRYFDPCGKPVRMQERGKRLWVEQIKLHGRWVWVDPAMAVELVRRELSRTGKNVEAEKTAAGYRFDLWCEGVGYEIKCVLGSERVVVYPNAVSTRRDEQLRRLCKLHQTGIKIVWVFVVLSPSYLEISLDHEFGRAIFLAQKKGLQVQVLRCANNRLRPQELVFTHSREEREKRHNTRLDLSSGNR